MPTPPDREEEMKQNIRGSALNRSVMYCRSSILVAPSSRRYRYPWKLRSSLRGGGGHWKGDVTRIWASCRLRLSCVCLSGVPAGQDGCQRHRFVALSIVLFHQRQVDDLSHVTGWAGAGAGTGCVRQDDAMCSLNHACVEGLLCRGRS